VIPGEPLKQRQLPASERKWRKVSHFGRAGMHEKVYKAEEIRKHKELHDLMMSWK